MITIREAVGGDDLETARELLREYAAYLNETVGVERINLENYERELAGLPGPYAAPRGTLLVAYVEDDAAGTVALKPLTLERSEFPAERAAELKRLWVRPQFRGMAIGRKLSNAVIDAARERGYTAVYLDTIPRVMESASQLYKELGFLKVERYLQENPVLRGAVEGVKYFRLEL